MTYTDEIKCDYNDQSFEFGEHNLFQSIERRSLCYTYNNKLDNAFVSKNIDIKVRSLTKH